MRRIWNMKSERAKAHIYIEVAQRYRTISDKLSLDNAMVKVANLAEEDAKIRAIEAYHKHCSFYGYCSKDKITCDKVNRFIYEYDKAK